MKLVILKGRSFLSPKNVAKDLSRFYFQLNCYVLDHWLVWYAPSFAPILLVQKVARRYVWYYYHYYTFEGQLKKSLN